MEKTPVQKMSFIQNIGYYLLLGACKLTGWLPDFILYGVLKPAIYLILYRLAGYRKKTVRENLANSFPYKTEKEIASIEKNFYLHLSEVFIDTVKLASISKRRILERMEWLDIKAHNIVNRNRIWIAAMSHFGSWELTVSFPLVAGHEVLPVYKPLKSAVFNRFYHHIRSRFGARPVAKNDTLREILKVQASGGLAALALIADQTPRAYETEFRYRFLNQDTVFYSGMGKIAKKIGAPVYFTYIRKAEKHKYRIEFIEIFDGKEDISEYEITGRYVVMLEAMIKETPHLWMWSHRRWKHNKPNHGK